MAGKQKSLMDIIGLLQHFRAGDSDREISRVLNIHRRTIRKYRQWAKQYHLLEMEKLPPVETICQLPIFNTNLKWNLTRVWEPRLFLWFFLFWASLKRKNNPDWQ